MKPCFFLLFSMLSTALLGKDISCIELNELWQTRLHQKYKISWQRNSFECPSNVQTLAVALNDLSATADLPNAPRFDDFVSNSVASISYWPFPSSEFPNFAHAATYYPERWVVLYPLFFSKSARIWRPSLLVHEATHAATGLPHVICSKGRDRGKQVCDSHFFPSLNTNPFSSQVYYFWWLRSTPYGIAHREEIEHNIRGIFDHYINYVDPKYYEQIFGRQ